MKALQKELSLVFNLSISSKTKFNKTFARIVFLASSILTTSVIANPTISITGEVKQGGLIVGKTNAKNLVTLNEKPLMVSRQGDYVFGFSRDDEQSYQLVITQPDGSASSKIFTPSKQDYKLQRIEGIKKSIMQPNPEAVARSQQDSKKIKEARKISSDYTNFAKGFIPPIKGTITGVYGSQRIYNGVPKRPHYGLDYAGKIGDPVKAPASGKVLLWVPDMFYSGGTMIIDHGHGISSTFLHLSHSFVKKGDMVKQGDVVASVGNSGRTTGPHLDWRINWFDVKIDPALVLKIEAL